MQTFMAVCLGIIALELGIVIAAVSITACKVSRAAQAVEMLAYRVDEQVEGIGEAMSSGWFQGAKAILGVFGNFFPWRK